MAIGTPPQRSAAGTVTMTTRPASRMAEQSRIESCPPRQRLLFITPVTPAETGNGLAMRAGLFLEALGQAYDTTLLVVPTSGPAPRVWSEFITARTTSRLAVCLDDAYGSPDTGEPAAPRDVAALRARLQPALSRFATAPVLEQVRGLVGDAVFDVVVVARLYLSPVLNALPALLASRPRLILDLDDDEVRTREQMGALHERRGELALARVEQMEAEKYRVLESEWVHRFDAVIVCAEEDRSVVTARTGHRHVHVVPNGVRTATHPFATSHGSADQARLLFVGSLSYFPNVDAAAMLCREVRPRLQDRLARPVRVDLVGARPTAPVFELEALEGVAVHANVADLAPFYRCAHAAVVPIRAGGGTRIKLLEAFAFGTPVVSTSIGANGLDVVAGRHLLIADEPAAIVDQCAQLVTDPSHGARLAGAARQLVEERYEAMTIAVAIRALVNNQPSRPPRFH